MLFVYVEYSDGFVFSKEYKDDGHYLDFDAYTSIHGAIIHVVIDF